MKKILSLILALALVMSLSVTAFAAESNTATDKTPGTKVVTGTYIAGSTSDVISVNIEWGSMAFTYTGASAGTWLPDSHSYSGATEAGWSCVDGENVITITNHSNVAVKATASFTKADGTNLTHSFTETSETANDGVVALATAVDTQVSAAPSANIVFNITGGSISADSNNLGTITVTIAKSTT